MSEYITVKREELREVHILLSDLRPQGGIIWQRWDEVQLKLIKMLAQPVAPEWHTTPTVNIPTFSGKAVFTPMDSPVYQREDVQQAIADAIAAHVKAEHDDPPSLCADCVNKGPCLERNAGYTLKCDDYVRGG